MSEDELRKLIYRAYGWMSQLQGEQRPDDELLGEMAEVADEYARDHNVSSSE